MSAAGSDNSDTPPPNPLPLSSLASGDFTLFDQPTLVLEQPANGSLSLSALWGNLPDISGPDISANSLVPPRGGLPPSVFVVHRQENPRNHEGPPEPVPLTLSASLNNPPHVSDPHISPSVPPGVGLLPPGASVVPGQENPYDHPALALSPTPLAGDPLPTNIGVSSSPLSHNSALRNSTALTVSPQPPLCLQPQPAPKVKLIHGRAASNKLQDVNSRGPDLVLVPVKGGKELMPPQKILFSEPDKQELVPGKFRTLKSIRILLGDPEAGVGPEAVARWVSAQDAATLVSTKTPGPGLLQEFPEGATLPFLGVLPSRKGNIWVFALCSYSDRSPELLLSMVYMNALPNRGQHFIGKRPDNAIRANAWNEVKAKAGVRQFEEFRPPAATIRSPSENSSSRQSSAILGGSQQHIVVVSPPPGKRPRLDSQWPVVIDPPPPGGQPQILEAHGKKVLFREIGLSLDLDITALGDIPGGDDSAAALAPICLDWRLLPALRGTYLDFTQRSGSAHAAGYPPLFVGIVQRQLTLPANWNIIQICQIATFFARWIPRLGNVIKEVRAEMGANDADVKIAIALAITIIDCAEWLLKFEFVDTQGMARGVQQAIARARAGSFVGTNACWTRVCSILRRIALPDPLKETCALNCTVWLAAQLLTTQMEDAGVVVAGTGYAYLW